MKLRYWLTALFCFLSFGLFGAEKDKGPKAYKNIGPEEFDKLRTDKAHVVLDVRTPREFSAAHLPEALNMDWYGADFEKKVTELDKSKVYLIHCAVGGRSARACDKMGKLGFTNLYNLEGGIKAWEKAGKAVVKPSPR